MASTSVRRLGRLLRPLAIVHDDVAAGPRQLNRDRPADASAGTGHQRGPP